MRIRDWRSDVCSSGRDQRGGDVALKCVLRALRGEDAEAVLLADGLLLVLGELLEATAAVEDLPELVHDVDQRAPVDQFLETVQEVIDHRNTDFGVVDDVCVVEADDRSEEHTSELQSLMRISYAVFCLKKKTNIDDKL